MKALKKTLPWFRAKREEVRNRKILLKGEKVSIREKRIVDVVDDYAWRTDTELARLDATRPIRMTYEEFYRFSEDEIDNPNSTSVRLAIDTRDGRHIGNCMYYDIDWKNSETEIGIMIGDRNYWGQGYGTDSVRTLLSHIFSATSLLRVYLHTLQWNKRAQSCFSKVGFQAVKPIRRGGLDFVLMDIGRRIWEDDQLILETKAAEKPPGVEF